MRPMVRGQWLEANGKRQMGRGNGKWCEARGRRKMVRGKLAKRNGKKLGLRTRIFIPSLPSIPLIASTTLKSFAEAKGQMQMEPNHQKQMINGQRSIGHRPEVRGRWREANGKRPEARLIG